MRKNRLREIWAEGGTVVNGWLAIPSGFSAETMAHQGWDSLTVDLQHGVVDYQSAVQMMSAISTTATVPMVRAPWLDSGMIMKLLDAGAYGLICPMVSSQADAEKLADATRYPPLGGRSFGPIRGLLYGGSDYPQHANDEIAVLAMIETKGGIDNLEDILKVDGIDGVYIGPSDLSLAVGCKPSFDVLEKPAQEAADYILAKTVEAGKIAGIHNMSTKAALTRKEAGYRFLTVCSDARLMAAGAQQVLGEMRPDGGARKEPQSGY
jgi:4-hydroxy-2-oxoheptanedioate aldolase